MHGDASYIRHNSGTQQQQAPSLNSVFYFKVFTTYLGWKRQWQAAQEREGKPVTPGQWMEQNTEVGLPAEYKMINCNDYNDDDTLLTRSDDLLGRGVGGAGPGVGEGRDGD